MNTQKWNEWLIRVGIVTLFSLMGYSLSQLHSFPSKNGPLLAIGGATIAAIALFIGSLLQPFTKSVEKSNPPQQLLGVKISTVAFLVALVGWLVAIFIHHKLGFVIIAVGIFSGFVGLVIHLLKLFSGRGNA